MNETLFSPLREYYALIEVLKRLRAEKFVASASLDVAMVCKALERRLENEEKERVRTRVYQRRYRASKRSAAE